MKAKAYIVHQAMCEPELKWSKPKDCLSAEPLYTAPPQRKSLAASEILNMMPSAIPAEYDGPLMEFARAIEAKLKEVV